MDNLSVVLELFLNSLEVPILKLGNSPVTLRAILQMLVLVALLYYLSGKLRTLIAERFLTRTRMELGARRQQHEQPQLDELAHLLDLHEGRHGVPAPGCFTIKPSASTRAKASRTGVGDTPRVRASSSMLSLAPGANAWVMSMSVTIS